MRQPGFYWVVAYPELAEEWTIGELYPHGWFLVGDTHCYPECDVIVGEYIGPPRAWTKE